MKKIIFVILCSGAAVASAETCLQTDKKGHAGDSRYYDYGRCAPQGPRTGADTSGAAGAVGQQLQKILSHGSGENDRGYSDEERAADAKTREAYRVQEDAYNKEQDAARARVRFGTWSELRNDEFDLAKRQFQNADPGAAKKDAVRAELGAAISAGKLIETYGKLDYADVKNPATWASSDPATRFKTCEVAAQLARAYVYGDFVKPDEKDPAKGLAIARAGNSANCGGAAYWLGRIYEDGDKAVPGVDKNELGQNPKSKLETVYETAIFNGYTPAYERLAELYRLGGPPRYRGKTYFVLPNNFYPYWSFNATSNDEMFLSRFQYDRCLQADNENLVCARGLRAVYGFKGKSVLDDYTNYNPQLAAYFEKYVKYLETPAGKRTSDWTPVFGSGSRAGKLIRSRWNGKCLDVARGKLVAGNTLQMWDCAPGAPAQAFEFTSTNDLRIGGLCVNDFTAAGANGDKIGLWGCVGAANEKWALVNGQIKGINGRCIGIDGTNRGNGTGLVLWDCVNGQANELWDVQ